MNAKPGLHAAALLATLALAACAITPARMALPKALADAQNLGFEGLGHGRSGSFSLDGQQVRFERSAERLGLGILDRLERERARLDIDIAPQTALAVHLRCRASRTDARLGSAAAVLRPFGLACDLSGASTGRLEIGETRPGIDGRAERQGRYSADGIELELRSVHTLQGSALPVASPAGYLLLQAGQPVAALDLSDTSPRLRRLPGPAARAATQAALALALLWDPAASAAP